MLLALRSKGLTETALRTHVQSTFYTRKRKRKGLEWPGLQTRSGLAQPGAGQGGVGTQCRQVVEGSSAQCRQQQPVLNILVPNWPSIKAGVAREGVGLLKGQPCLGVA